MRAASAVAIGIMSGALFFGHGMIDGSRYWPLIWPIAGGLVAGSLDRRRPGTGWLSGLRVGAEVGALSAALFFVGSVGALTALGLMPRSNSGAGLTGLAIAASLGFALATIAGGTAHFLFARKQAD